MMYCFLTKRQDQHPPNKNGIFEITHMVICHTHAQLDTSYTERTQTNPTHKVYVPFCSFGHALHFVVAPPICTCTVHIAIPNPAHQIPIHPYLCLFIGCTQLTNCRVPVLPAHRDGRQQCDPRRGETRRLSQPHNGRGHCGRWHRDH